VLEEGTDLVGFGSADVGKQGEGFPPVRHGNPIFLLFEILAHATARSSTPSRRPRGKAGSTQLATLGRSTRSASRDRFEPVASAV
jgi:hypothetical protein